MDKRTYTFDPPAVVSIPVQGESAEFPVRRIFCVGRNYAAHAREMGAEVDRTAPWYFNKAREAVVLSGSTIPYPPGTHNLHHEMEMVVALGAGAFQIEAKNALDAVFGYTCGVDLTRRDLQTTAKERRLPWDFGKDFENAAVISAIAPVAQCGHPVSGTIELAVNGDTRQRGDLSQMIWPVAELIAFLSGYYHLQAGDLIYTGTPEGVGPVQPGDRLSGHIEGVGELELLIEK
jgi:fumarylpyruvate hydrolase